MGRGWGLFHANYRFFFIALIALLFFSTTISFGAENPETLQRDPRQLTVIVADFDETVASNFGNYWVTRVNQPESIDPFFAGRSGLPTEIAVPTNDMEGNTGPRILKRLGHLDIRGHFVPSTSTEPITLSNGQVIIPAYYYLDKQWGFREFREADPGEPSFIKQALDAKARKKDPFLLDGYLFMAVALQSEFKDRMKGISLTMRGNSPRELKKDFWDSLARRLKMGPIDMPEEANIALHHPSCAEFGCSKINYLKKLHENLTNRQMPDSRKTPHYLIVLENNREMLLEMDAFFRVLANEGVFVNPVVPVLVNFVEPEVLAQPMGFQWEDSPMKSLATMSRVTIYHPNSIERSDDIGRALQVSLGLSAKEAHSLLESQITPYSCKPIFESLGKRKSS